MGIAATRVLYRGLPTGIQRQMQNYPPGIVKTPVRAAHRGRRQPLASCLHLPNISLMAVSHGEVTFPLYGQPCELTSVIPTVPVMGEGGRIRGMDAGGTGGAGLEQGGPTPTWRRN